jgi:hypothetical protein
MNMCVCCKEDFASVRMFDNHRVGKHEYLYSEGLRMDPPREDGRRCLDADEMLAKGWQQDEQGLWFSPESREKAREYFSDVHGTPESASDPSDKGLTTPEASMSYGTPSGDPLSPRSGTDSSAFYQQVLF